MASPTTPTHGKMGAIYRQRPNNFKGDGLNDLAWGTGYNGASSAYYEVVIDGAGTPDTFKWRKDGGSWTELVAITGSAQTLDSNQTVTFGATTGHTVGDQWTIGNLKDEACTESGAEAQITDATKRLLNPNKKPVFTDSGGKQVLIIDYTQGKAVFSGNVGVVTVTGNNSYIVEAGLEKVGYLFNWEFTAELDLVEGNRMGQDWKEHYPGQGGGSGRAESYFIGTDSFFDSIEAAAGGSQAYFLLELFNYDPDQDQTGDHFLVWAVFNRLNPAAPVGDLVKEALEFTLHGIPSFKANA